MQIQICLTIWTIGLMKQVSKFVRQINAASCMSISSRMVLALRGTVAASGTTEPTRQ